MSLINTKDIEEPGARENCGKGMWIEHVIQVCTYDIDFAGHVSNINYLRWLEDMRFRLFEKYCPLKGFLDEGKTPVLVSTNIEYKRPIKLFQEPHGFMWVSNVTKASLSIDAEFVVDGVVTTRAKHVGVFVEVRSGKAIRIPASFLQTYEESNSGSCAN